MNTAAQDGGSRGSKSTSAKPRERPRKSSNGKCTESSECRKKHGKAAPVCDQKKKTCRADKRGRPRKPPTGECTKSSECLNKYGMAASVCDQKKKTCRMDERRRLFKN